jgi:hypothetical protein
MGSVEGMRTEGFELFPMNCDERWSVGLVYEFVSGKMNHLFVSLKKSAISAHPCRA